MQLGEPSQGGPQSPLGSPGGFAVPNMEGEHGKQDFSQPGGASSTAAGSLGLLCSILTGKHCLVVAGEGKLTPPKTEVGTSL